MEHPFASLSQLTVKQKELVSGGTLNKAQSQKFSALDEPLPIIKPPICTTLAIGEEGGGLASLF